VILCGNVKVKRKEGNNGLFGTDKTNKGGGTCFNKRVV